MIGDNILIERAGDVIPALVKAFPEERTGEEVLIEYPQNCPVCEGETRKLEDGARIYCVNSSCSGQSRRLLVRFVARDFMDIDGISTKQIDQLVHSWHA